MNVGRAALRLGGLTAAVSRRAELTVGAMGPPRRRGWTWRRLACLLVAAGLPAGKAVDVGGWWSVSDGVRQLVLALVVGAVALAVCWPRAAAVGSWQLAWPRPRAGKVLRGGRAARLTLGASGPLLCAASLGAHLRGWPPQAVGAVAAAALVPVSALAAWEVHRHRQHRLSPAGTPPDRAVLWNAAPATLWWAALVVQAVVRGVPLSDDLGDVTVLGVAGPGGEALGTAVVIGLGEEYLFRGLLLVAVVRAGLHGHGFALVSASFALWHLPDAWGGGPLAVVGTLAAMFAVSHLVLVPLRLRGRSLAGPALLHAANNVALRLVT